MRLLLTTSAVVLLLSAAPASATVVTTTADSGAGSLRQALVDTAPGGTVTFDPSVTGTITLTTGELAVNKALTIEGPGARALRVSGNDTSRVFNVSAAATINGLTITNGKAATTGGAIITTANLTLQDSAVLNSRAGPSAFVEGGGIKSGGGSTLTVRRSLVANNRAEGTSSAVGGGIDTDCCTSTVVVENSTITGNVATATNGADAGGLEAEANVAIRNSTIAFNSATATSTRGGGVLAIQDSTVTRTLSASIIAANTVSGGGTDDCETSGTPNFLGNDNVVGDATGCNLTGTNNAIPNAAPGLAALANNGGPTDTIALTAVSPALDRVASGCPPPTTDQRSRPRPAGPACDSGAFEAQFGLAISPPSADFGTVTLGGTSGAKGFTVTNTGERPANLNSVTVDNAQFKSVGARADLGRCPVTFSPGDTCSVVLTFTPAAAGVATGTLTVGSSDAGAVQAALTGTGVAPPPPPDPCAADKTNPVVKITSDQRTTLYGLNQKATITIKASDASGLKSNPSASKVKLSTKKAGTFTIRKRAIDKCGRSTTKSFTYRVAAPPRAAVSHGNAPTGCPASLPARVTVTSAISLRSVKLLLDGRTIKTSKSKSFIFNAETRRLSNGKHRLQVIVVDAAGQRATALRIFGISCSNR